MSKSKAYVTGKDKISITGEDALDLAMSILEHVRDRSGTDFTLEIGLTINRDKGAVRLSAVEELNRGGFTRKYDALVYDEDKGMYVRLQ